MRFAKAWIPIAWAVLVGGLAPAAAHEFWLAPHRHRVEPGERIVAALRVVDMMRGAELPYLSTGFETFTVTTPSGTRPVVGMEGDIPALSIPAGEPGLHVLAYRSTANEVTYDSWDTFARYLAYDGLEHIAAAHRARGLPESGFTESYARSAKALVQVGPAGEQDRDRPLGLPLELVAENNPYAPGAEAVEVRLLRAGQPVVGRQVAVFRYDGVVTRTTFATDGDGRARIPLAGGGTFLLNAVDLQATEAEAVWASEWASLSFGLPIRLPELHPLDPLLQQEIARAVRVIVGSGRADDRTRVALVTLAEPDKAEVLAWRPGQPANRKALALVRNGPDMFEALVNLAAGRLERWEGVPGAQPPIHSSEWAAAERLTKADPRWLAAMRARGYEDVSQIFCEALSAGYFDLPEHRGRRLLKMPCYDVEGARTNIYGRPIEGVISVVDLNAGEVVRVIDEGRAPVSAEDHGLGAPARLAPNPAPASSSFILEGRKLTWGEWSLRLGFDQRFGPVVSLVTHEDGGAKRMVLYQGHLSEVFVPYMDGSEGWYFRSYMDAGEYGLGALASPLEPGLDCPEGAAFLDGDLARPNGEPYVRKRLTCVFERDAGAPLWRHWEAYNGVHAGRPATELVVRAIPSVGNYDYIVDWVFTQSGEIRIDIGATGIAAVKGVDIASMTAPGAVEATRTGALVAPNLVAVHHDHYFSLRLDLDVDGPVNSFVRERLAPVSLAAGPRRSLWRLEPTAMAAEGALSAHHGPEVWRIENPAVETALGGHPGFEIVAHGGATSLLKAEDWPQRRAAFSAETLWITARKPGELFAAGPYPNQNPGGDGLPSYVDGDSVIAADLVAWPTIGFHHVTRPEDWPVVSTMWHGVRLRPRGFFAQNPGLGGGEGRRREESQARR